MVCDGSCLPSSVVISMTDDGLVESAPQSDYRVLKPATWHWPEEKVTAIHKRVYRAIQGYPELEGCTVNVGVMHDSTSVNGRADWYNHLIKFPSNGEIPSNVTVWHEVAHIACHKAANDGSDHSYSSEEFTSILAMSRMPVELIDEDRIPYINSNPTAPKHLYSEICSAALDYREENGKNSHYIKQCNEWLENPERFRGIRRTEVTA